MPIVKQNADRLVEIRLSGPFDESVKKQTAKIAVDCVLVRRGEEIVGELASGFGGGGGAVGDLDGGDAFSTAVFDFDGGDAGTGGSEA